ncbi:MAG TPA: hypothetical protein VIW29_08960 [Polyangiaceae bacterium]
MRNLNLSSLVPVLLVGLVGCSGSPATSAEPPAPQPDEPAGPEPEPATTPTFLLQLSLEKLPIAQGDESLLEVELQRQGGFEGPVEITVSGLPKGASAEPLTIAADEAKAMLTIRTAATAPHSLPTTVTVSGKAGKLADSRQLSVTVYGTPGALDTSFQGGKVMVPVGAADAYAYAMAAQPDGKIIVVGTMYEHQGDFAVLRLTRDGELDTSFGEAGLVATQVGEGSDVARAVAVDEAGRIVVAGTASSPASGLDFAVVRYLPSGELDDSFGDAGKRIVSLGDDSDTAYALALQSDGKIVVGGDSNRGSSSSGVDFALLRLLEDGSTDSSFGDAGIVTQSVKTFGSRDSIYGLALQTIDGEERIVAAGGEGDFSLARFHDDGTLDRSFGEQGTLSGLFESTIGAAFAVTVTPDNELVVAGHAQHDFALAKLAVDGTFFDGFGDGGKVVTAISEDNWDEAHALGLDQEGRILLAGWTYEGNSSSGNTTLVRYDAEGALDTSFGAEGIVVTEVAAPTRADQGSALLIAPDERVPSERILVGGYASRGYSQFAVTRFWR